MLAARHNDNILAKATNAPGEAQDLGIKVVDRGGLREQLGLPPNFKGVVVKGVDPRGPAAQAGLRDGDIVVKFNGKNVENVAVFVSEARKVKEGNMVRLFIRRADSGMFLAFKR